jgi:SNF2 family DNA or RNA helicase
MSNAQKEIYENEKSKIRNLIIENLNNPVKKNTSFIIIQALTKLRQIANHPLMTDENYTENSGKFEDVIRDIENITKENRKVLIFSSFVKHLNIYKNYFDKNNMSYSILTGQTTNREKVISEFQENKKNKIFLISIKAGGTGINLTQADYVFILDPWWNPAVEKQALSRAHRIGQDKKVMVYRYISKNTIEEKIVKLHSQKRDLADNLLEGSEMSGKMSVEAMLQLIEDNQ